VTDEPLPKTTETILVVDDNEMNRDMLSRRLERRGYRVLVADDGQPALDLIASEAIDLVLLDIMMPGVDGVEVLKTIRQRFSQDDLPVIMTTAKSDSRNVVEALDLGANDYVTKPIDFPVVLARVQKELRSRARTRGGSGAMASGSGIAAGSGGGSGPLLAPGVAAQTMSNDLGPGSVIAGRYKLESKLGAGNFGAVYRGLHLGLDKPVAIKILQTKVEESGAALERFRSEGRSACLIRHPNAVAVHDFGVTPDGTAFLVMDLLEGTSLGDELKKFGRLTPHRIADLLPAICSVLAQAHAAGVVHRDIKPENIFLHRAIDGESVKVLDFGIAKLVSDRVTSQNLTAEGFILGTPAYMAPERLRNQPYDGRADVYSLGCLLFQLLTGRLPFPGKQGEPMAMLLMHLNDPPPSVAVLVPMLGRELDELVQACMEKDPGKRPAIHDLPMLFRQAAGRKPPATRSEAFEDAPTHELVSGHASTTRMALPPSRQSTGWLNRLLDRVFGPETAPDADSKLPKP
jgi:serine/threonine protein kinase/CheY-like chemotaxis protein